MRQQGAAPALPPVLGAEDGLHWWLHQLGFDKLGLQVHPLSSVGGQHRGIVSPTSIERNPPVWSLSTLNIPNPSQALLLLFLLYFAPLPLYSF